MHTNDDTFAAFDSGRLTLPERTRVFADLPWNPHPKFAGVALKHVLTASDTGGKFSYHLVRIDPGCGIGNHAHPTQLETHEVVAGEGICVNAGVEAAYRPGVVSVFEANVPHEVRAGGEGLRLFAKFMPALLLVMGASVPKLTPNTLRRQPARHSPNFPQSIPHYRSMN